MHGVVSVYPTEADVTTCRELFLPLHFHHLQRKLRPLRHLDQREVLPKTLSGSGDSQWPSTKSRPCCKAIRRSLITCERPQTDTARPKQSEGGCPLHSQDHRTPKLQPLGQLRKTQMVQSIIALQDLNSSNPLDSTLLRSMWRHLSGINVGNRHATCHATWNRGALLFLDSCKKDYSGSENVFMHVPVKPRVCDLGMGPEFKTSLAS